MNSKLQDILAELLHKYDHEPDEITKYVVIDQTEFVPEAEKAIRQAVAEEILEIVDSPSATLVGSDGAWIKQAELRQKIKEYGGLK
jgi:hypothetical protein